MRDRILKFGKSIGRDLSQVEVTRLIRRGSFRRSWQADSKKSEPQKCKADSEDKQARLDRTYLHCEGAVSFSNV